MGFPKSHASQTWSRMASGIEAGIVGGAAMLGMLISESLWSGHVWWEVPNLLGSTFYGTRVAADGNRFIDTRRYRVAFRHYRNAWRLIRVGMRRSSPARQTGAFGSAGRGGMVQLRQCDLLAEGEPVGSVGLAPSCNHVFAPSAGGLPGLHGAAAESSRTRRSRWDVGSAGGDSRTYYCCRIPRTFPYRALRTRCNTCAGCGRITVSRLLCFPLFSAEVVSGETGGRG